MNELSDVMDHYRATRARLSKAFSPNTIDQHAIATTIPAIFSQALFQMGKIPTNYKVEGSYGAGNIALCPWVAIFDKRITQSAQNGYYIVLLFSEDMSRCYLSLNQGFTSYKQAFSSQRLARRKAREAAHNVARLLNPSSQAVVGQIDLAATSGLGRGYEECAIISYSYERTSLPSVQQLLADLQMLLTAYEALYSISGPTLLALAPFTESDYQEEVNEAAMLGLSDPAALLPENPGPEPVPENTQPTLVPGKSYRRNSRKAGEALLAARFRCEIDETHTSFTSKKTSRPYVEAHHLLPMGFQGKWPVSLDVRANIVALCPTCHRLLHHGNVKEKKPALRALHKRRMPALAQKGIEIEFPLLAKMYSEEIDEDTN